MKKYGITALLILLVSFVGWWYFGDREPGIPGHQEAWVSVKTLDHNPITTLVGWGEVQGAPFAIRWTGFKKEDATQIGIKGNPNGTFDLLVGERFAVRCDAGLFSEIESGKVIRTGKDLDLRSIGVEPVLSAQLEDRNALPDGRRK